MAKKPVEKPAEPVVEEAPKFTPCSQCGNPTDCERSNWCVKGFK